MSEQPEDQQTQGQQPDDTRVPGGGLAGNEEGASSDGDSGPEGAGRSGQEASGYPLEDAGEDVREPSTQE